MHLPGAKICTAVIAVAVILCPCWRQEKCVSIGRSMAETYTHTHWHLWLVVDPWSKRKSLLHCQTELCSPMLLLSQLYHEATLSQYNLQLFSKVSPCLSVWGAGPWGFSCLRNSLHSTSFLYSISILTHDNRESPLLVPRSISFDATKWVVFSLWC